MTLFRFIGEKAPVVRPVDLLTEDHPLRPYPPLNSVRNSAWVRGLVFAVVFFVAMILWTSTFYLSIGTVSSMAQYSSELFGAVVAYFIVAFLMEARVWPYEVSPRRLLGLLKGMALGVVLASVCVGVIALTGSYRVTGTNGDYSPWVDLFVVVIVAGLYEEIICRGVIFRLVEEGLGTWGAAVVSALIFGALHLNNSGATWWDAIATVIDAGLLFAAVYVVTRSLWWCIGLHFAWNIMEGPVFGSTVSGVATQNSWLTPSWTGPGILTGGAFGLVGSIVPVILMGILSIALLVYAAGKGLMVSPIWVRKNKLTLE